MNKNWIVFSNYVVYWWNSSLCRHYLIYLLISSVFIPIQEVIDSLQEKLNVNAINHFALVLQNTRSSNNKLSIVHDYETLADVSNHTNSTLSYRLEENNTCICWEQYNMCCIVLYIFYCHSLTSPCVQYKNWNGHPYWFIGHKYCTLFKDNWSLISLAECITVPTIFLMRSMHNIYLNSSYIWSSILITFPQNMMS